MMKDFLKSSLHNLAFYSHTVLSNKLALNISKGLALSATKGFTLIELIVVIAILGVLAAVLITTIDPVDKIKSANDAGIITVLKQVGRGEDTYAVNKSNFYTGGTTINTALSALSTAGESKISSYTPPSGYTITVLESPVSCTGGSTCTGYAVLVSNLKSKKYASTPVYQVVNGKGCFVATAITQAQLNTGSGTGFCP